MTSFTRFSCKWWYSSWTI